MKRSKFLWYVFAGGGGSLLPAFSLNWASTQVKSILFLGGTDFVGPHIINEALRRGIEVTIFNRGLTNPDLFPNLEFIEGNRYPNIGKGLTGLLTDRQWDIVVDTWQKEPGCVNQTAQLLAGRCSHYIYISSIAVYKNYKSHGINEEYDVINGVDSINSFDPNLDYSSRKAASEAAILKYFPKSSTIMRCGTIMGESWNPNNTEPVNYYAHNFVLGKPMILPNDPIATFQLVDVKDLASFVIKSIINLNYGIYNVTGPSRPLLFTEYLKIYHEASGSLSPIVWADPEWLIENGVKPWTDLPNWVRWNESEPGFYTIDNRKAIGAGLNFRDVNITLTENLPDLHLSNLKHVKVHSGLSDSRHKELIALHNKG